MTFFVRIESSNEGGNAKHGRLAREEATAFACTTLQLCSSRALSYSQEDFVSLLVSSNIGKGTIRRIFELHASFTVFESFSLDVNEKAFKSTRHWAV